MGRRSTVGEKAMRAMILDTPNTPLRGVERPRPQAGAGQLLLRVEACGVCRTDLHLVDGELPDPRLPVGAGKKNRPGPGPGRGRKRGD